MYCPNCAPERRGFRIVFPDSSECSEVADSLRDDCPSSWRLIDTRILWIRDALLHARATYWQAYRSPDTWRFEPAIDPLACVDAEPIAWADLRASLPKVWIDNVISEERIQMHCQRIVDTDRGGRVVGYEMLARASEPDGAPISPVDLFGAARQQGRLFHLDRACRIAAIRAAAYLTDHTRIFINFIPASIYKPEHCLRTTFAEMTRVGISPERIIFEVVETDHASSPDHLARIFDYYRARGVECALDDVGSGLNTIALIDVLRPNVVKLDRSIAAGVATDPACHRQAELVMEACDRVGARPLAEGIETEEDAQALRLLGYAWQQGYHHGRPEKPAERAMAMAA